MRAASMFRRYRTRRTGLRTLRRADPTRTLPRTVAAPAPECADRLLRYAVVATRKLAVAEQPRGDVPAHRALVNSQQRRGLTGAQVPMLCTWGLAPAHTLLIEKSSPIPPGLFCRLRARRVRGYDTEAAPTPRRAPRPHRAPGTPPTPDPVAARWQQICVPLARERPRMSARCPTHHPRESPAIGPDLAPRSESGARGSNSRPQAWEAGGGWGFRPCKLACSRRIRRPVATPGP